MPPATLPAVTLPVTVAVPPVDRLPTVAVPVELIVPATLTPVPVTTITFALPALLKSILPLSSTCTLLVPFDNKDVLIVWKLKPPEPFVVNTCPFEPPVIVILPIAFKFDVPVTANVPIVAVPVVVTLPAVAVPVTAKLVNEPTEVMLG